MEYSVIWKKEILSLLSKAIGCLEEAEISESEWTFGGGSALMFWYWHRESRDVDIFLTNPQYIVMLSPRLNDYAERIATDYWEASNFVKIVLEDREIDFIVAPHLTGITPVKKKLSPGMEVFVEQPEEIVVKKFFYRTEKLKLRDFFDAYAVLKDDRRSEKLKAILGEVLKGKEEILRQRAVYLREAVKKHGFSNALRSLSVSPFLIEKIPENFVEIVVNEILGEALQGA